MGMAWALVVLAAVAVADQDVVDMAPGQGASYFPTATLLGDALADEPVPATVPAGKGTGAAPVPAVPVAETPAGKGTGAAPAPAAPGGAAPAGKGTGAVPIVAGGKGARAPVVAATRSAASEAGMVSQAPAPIDPSIDPDAINCTKTDTTTEPHTTDADLQLDRCFDSVHESLDYTSDQQAIKEAMNTTCKKQQTNEVHCKAKLRVEALTPFEKEDEFERYAKIPYFVMKDDAKKEEKATNKEDCQAACTKRPECKSVSFSAAKQDCLWSTHALSFNGEFTFYAKRAFPGAKDSGKNLLGKYRSFMGLMYQSKEFTRYQGKTQPECREFCNIAVDGHGRRCNGFSYRERDQTCLLSPFGLTYNADYDYYERNPRPVPKMVEKVDPATGETSVEEVPGEEVVPPIDAAFVLPKVEAKMTPAYKAQIQVQEAAAKSGAKELAYKKRTGKVAKQEKQTFENQIEVMKEKEAEKTSGPVKGNAEIIQKGVEEREEKTEAEEERTSKQYQLTLKNERDAQLLKQQEDQRKFDDAMRQAEVEQRKKMAEEKEKEQSKKTEENAKEQAKKTIFVIVAQGRTLAFKERRNKERDYNAKEARAKQKVVKLEVKTIKENRHAKHEKEFEDFVQKTTERHLKVRETDTAVAIAMKQTKKQRITDLGHAQDELKRVRALTHATMINVEKLKAQADGYQHEINMDAKRGKKSPQAEVKLQYTMDSLRNEQNKVTYRKQEVQKLEKGVLEDQESLKKLDEEMTKKGIGRRRRNVEDSTHAPPNMNKGTPKMPTLIREPENPALQRRRRSEARLNEQFETSLKQSGGDGATQLPGVPATKSPYAGDDRM
jgi:hypothetical protein